MNLRARMAIERAQAERAAGRKSTAAALAKVAFEAAPDSPTAFALWSVTLRDHEQPGLRVDACWRHLELVPGNQHAWLALSDAHEAMGNLSRALEAAQRCVEIAPQWDVALQQLARLQFAGFSGVLTRVVVAPVAFAQ